MLYVFLTFNMAAQVHVYTYMELHVHVHVDMLYAHDMASNIAAQVHAYLELPVKK